MLEEHERKKQYEEAYASKCQEIAFSPMVLAAGATYEAAQKQFARWLLDDKILDTTRPFESYVILDMPNGKDEKRIYDIVNKANAGLKHCCGMITIHRLEMIKLAKQMNHAIKDEGKRERRRDACLKYGLKFLANCFVKESQHII